MYFQEERKRTVTKYESGEKQEDFKLEDGKDPSEALFQALSRTVANRWKAMSDEEKKPYYDRAKAEMKKYRDKMDEYNQNIINSSSLAQKLKANQTAQSKKDPNPNEETDPDRVVEGPDRKPAATMETHSAQMNQDVLLGSLHPLLRRESAEEFALSQSLTGASPFPFARAPSALQHLFTGMPNQANSLSHARLQLLGRPALGMGHPRWPQVAPSLAGTSIRGGQSYPNYDLATIMRLELAQGRTPGSAALPAQAPGLRVGLHDLQFGSSLFGHHHVNPILGSAGLVGGTPATVPPRVHLPEDRVLHQLPALSPQEELILQDLLRRRDQNPNADNF